MIELILIGKPDGHHGLGKFRGLLLTGEHFIGGRRQQGCRLLKFRKAPSEVAILHIVGELEFLIFIGAASCERSQQGCIASRGKLTILERFIRYMDWIRPDRLALIRLSRDPSDSKLPGKIILICPLV